MSLEPDCCPICFDLLKKGNTQGAPTLFCIEKSHNYEIGFNKGFKKESVLFEMTITKEAGSYYSAKDNTTEVGIYNLDKQILEWNPVKLPGRLIVDENWKIFIQNHCLLL